DEPTKSHPWDDALRRAAIATQSGTLRGILWHQGESDSTPELAEAYAGKLVDLVDRFRQALASPEVPFLVGQLGQFADSPWTEQRRMVDAAHRALPGQIPRTAFVPSDGLGHKGDKVHFEAAALREFEELVSFAESFLLKGNLEPFLIKEEGDGKSNK
ncbi:MAG: sialate O-acetylesterase, partial [Flavobacteriia bacterium]